MSQTLTAIRHLVDSERLGAVVTVVAGPGLGSKAVLDSRGQVLAGSMPQQLASRVGEDAIRLMATEQSRTLTYDDSDVFIETIAPEPHLLIFGAGHIAQPLSRMAQELGFRVTVADAREAWATPERFPEVDGLVVGWPDAVFDRVELDQRTYLVLLSHDSRFEDPVFAAVRGAPVRYIGALGSRRTAARRAERLAEAGWSETEIAAIHAPIGIDIGAEEPSEVAVSILAEIVQARYGHGSGLPLHGHSGRIHRPRSDEAP